MDGALALTVACEMDGIKLMAVVSGL